jgi:hypothetical protein
LVLSTSDLIQLACVRYRIVVISSVFYQCLFRHRDGISGIKIQIPHTIMANQKHSRTYNIMAATASSIYTLEHKQTSKLR